MVGYTNINKYINYLINNQLNNNIIVYVKKINKLKYNIDISFIDEFIELVSKDECCIPLYSREKINNKIIKLVKLILLFYYLFLMAS